jgi:hypothetical protein
MIRTRKKANGAIAGAIREVLCGKPHTPRATYVLRDDGLNATFANHDAINALFGQERDARFGTH